MSLSVATREIGEKSGIDEPADAAADGPVPVDLLGVASPANLAAVTGEIAPHVREIVVAEGTDNELVRPSGN
jgi:hypothetical protein